MNKKEVKMDGVTLDTPEIDGVVSRLNGPYKPLFLTLNQARWLEEIIDSYAYNSKT